jgi:hypothetical protein
MRDKVLGGQRATAALAALSTGFAFVGCSVAPAAGAVGGGVPSGSVWPVWGNGMVSSALVVGVTGSYSWP